MINKKCVIIKQEQKILSLLFHDNRLLRAEAAEEDGGLLGNIYLGKVKNVVKNIQAVFLEIQPGFPCFLDMDSVRQPFIVNRKYDGRLLAGDEIVVQVSREAVKTKPPTVTGTPSLDGKYCAVSMGKPGIAYSAKLSEKVKHRLAEALRCSDFPLETYARDYGIVIRTNARDLAADTDAGITPLTEEVKKLAGMLASIMDAALHRTCYSLLFRKPESYLTAFRDMYQGQYEEIVTDDEQLFHRIEAFRADNPDYHLPGVRLYQEEGLPLAKLYSVAVRLQEALSRKVWLKSGGYLVIEPTEALTVIDVNSGKITSRKGTEETYLHINTEAAAEIALQLTLRNLSGIIVIDFINMRLPEHKKKLMAYFGDLLKKDPVKTRLVDITALGLVEVTRMKTSKPLREQLIQ